MPSLVTPARRAREVDSDDEDYNSPASSRRRANTNGDTIRTVSAPEEDEDHSPGAIVRVTLTNFVTYGHADFYPGPRLNMVIGPNGNGKSTLVCAICLGLGWGSQHLGRAKDVGDFVKHGMNEATIEIELKRDGVKYTRNPVITAKIRRDGNQMSFLLNGKQSSKKACMNVAKSFSIQIDNLCQFLPQDRVVEFAALSPIELLKSTERAIASEEMIEWHEMLSQFNKDIRTLQQNNKTEIDQLKNLENRQRRDEPDVQRLREREVIKLNIERLQAVRPLVEYRTKAARFVDARTEHVKSVRELAELTDREAPALRSVNDKEAYATTIKTFRDRSLRKMTNAEQDVATKQQEIAAWDRKWEALRKRDEAKQREMKGEKQEITRLQGVIQNLKIESEKGPPQFDVAAKQSEIREIARMQNDLREKTDDLKRQQNEGNQQASYKNNEISRLESEIGSLDSQAGKQEQFLKRKSPETWKAWDWIKKNQSRFRQPILGPPMIECSVSDANSKLADILESLIQQGDMITLTAQNVQDQQELHRIIKDEMHLKKVSTRCAPDAQRLRSPLSEDELRAIGMDGWAKDYIQGPSGIVAMLCEAANLHRTAVCLHRQSEAEFTAAARSTLGGWATPDNTYRVMRRAEYGAGASSTTVRPVRRAQYWTDQPIDSSIKQGLQSNINSLKQDLHLLEENADARTAELKALSAKYHELGTRLTSAENEKKDRLKAQSRFEGLATKIKSSEEKLEEKRETLARFRQTIQKSTDDRDQMRLEKAQAVLTYADAVLALQKTAAELQEVEIMLIEAESDVQILRQANTAAKKRIEDKQAEVATLAQEKSRLKSQVAALTPIVSQLGQDEDLKPFIATFDATIGMDVHELNIQQEKERLDLMHDGNAGVVKLYVEREQTIKKLKTKLEQMENAINEVNTKLEDVRGKWEPRIDALVKQISSAFSHNMGKIHCNGSVEIDKHEDFDQWSIQIFVRFREGEEMTRLDSHRQSGGERAVSTVFYLMSLQTLTRSPFRVVDEINQGMDPRNERLVHSRMVAIATGNDDWTPEDMSDILRQVDVEERVELGRNKGSQYFLITPKLLDDLRYEEGMTILCVVSGEHVYNNKKIEQENGKVILVPRKINFAKSALAYGKPPTRTAIAA